MRLDQRSCAYHKKVGRADAADVMLRHAYAREASSTDTLTVLLRLEAFMHASLWYKWLRTQKDRNGVRSQYPKWFCSD